MKFYYNDRLVRTSKTRHYKYVIMYKEQAVSLSETRTNAERALSNTYAMKLRAIKNYIEVLEKTTDAEYKTKHPYDVPRAQQLENYRKNLQSLDTDLRIEEVIEK